MRSVALGTSPGRGLHGIDGGSASPLDVADKARAADAAHKGLETVEFVRRAATRPRWTGTGRSRCDRPWPGSFARRIRRTVRRHSQCFT